MDDIALDNYAGQQTLLKFGFEHDPNISEVFRVKIDRERFIKFYDNDGSR